MHSQSVLGSSLVGRQFADVVPWFYTHLVQRFEDGLKKISEPNCEEQIMEHMRFKLKLIQ